MAVSLAAFESGEPISRLNIRVRFYEVDLMGIVHHSIYLRYFELGRVEWCRERGLTYADMALAPIDKQMHLPVVEVTLRYKAPAKFDDELTLETVLAESKGFSATFVYRLLKGEKVLCIGSTRLACTNGHGALMPLHPVLSTSKSKKAAKSE
jgi:acyl-CoA thioester hydrolase